MVMSHGNHPYMATTLTWQVRIEWARESAKRVRELGVEETVSSSMMAIWMGDRLF